MNNSSLDSSQHVPISKMSNKILTPLFDHITILEVTQRFDPINWPSQDKEYPKGSCRVAERYRILCAETDAKKSCEVIMVIITKLTELGLIWAIRSHEDTGYIEISAVAGENERADISPETKDKDYYEEIRRQINKIHAELREMPDKHRIGYQISVPGILNAYREGDILFESALELLEMKPAK